jgi:hypothetical protein
MVDVSEIRHQRYLYEGKANPFCREAEMIDLKKKCWREKVTAEITVAHMLQFAREMGANMSAAEAAVFLNEKGRAQAVWTHMMEAGEAFLKSDLAGSPEIPTPGRSAARSAASANPLHRKFMATEAPPISYQ